jgi:uncharacterized protein YciI
MAAYFAVRTRPTRPAMMVEGLNEQERASFARHSAWLQRKIEEGAAVFVGRTSGRGADGWALGVFKAQSEAAARDLMLEDPFVQEGVVTAELFPFDIIYPRPENA